MRDDYDFFDINDRVVEYRDHPNDSWKFYGSSIHRHQTTRSYRDEAQPTVKVGATYVRSTPYSAFFFTSNCSGGSYQFTTPLSAPTREFRVVMQGGGATSMPGPTIMTHGCRSAMPHDPDVPHYLVSQAEGRAMDGLKSGAHDFGQTLGEIRETFGYLVATVFQLRDAIRAVRKRDPRALARALGFYSTGRKRSVGSKANSLSKDIAKQYLGYQYAFKPLMADIFAAAEVIQGKIPELAGKVVANLDDTPYEALRPALYPNVNATIDGEFKRGVEVGIRVAVRNPLLYNLDRYGVTDPLALAWELVPLSFVLNWFTGISSFLDALTRPMGVQFLDGYRTTYVENRYTCEYRLIHENVSEGTLPKLAVNHHSSRRMIYWDWPLPTPYVSLDLGKGANQKLMSIAALARALA